MSSARHILTLSCVNRPGIVAKVATALFDGGFNIIDAQQFDDIERKQVRCAEKRQQPRRSVRTRHSAARTARSDGSSGNAEARVQDAVPRRDRRTAGAAGISGQRPRTRLRRSSGRREGDDRPERQFGERRHLAKRRQHGAGSGGALGSASIDVRAEDRQLSAHSRRLPVPGNLRSQQLTHRTGVFRPRRS